MRWIVLLLLIGCEKEYNAEICEDLSLKKYRGFPRASRDFDDNCKNYKIKYTQGLCKKAFLDLVTHGYESKLKQDYGDRVLECFTKRQLEKNLR